MCNCRHNLNNPIHTCATVGTIQITPKPSGVSVNDDVAARSTWASP